VMAMLILLLLPEAWNRGEPLWWIGLSGGCCLLLAVLFAGVGFARRRRQRFLGRE
jgi:hypothetical protein